MSRNQEQYLGDGLYGRYDGYALWLRAPHDHRDHVVALEPHVMLAFLRYAAQIPRFHGLLRKFVHDELTSMSPIRMSPADE